MPGKYKDKRKRRGHKGQGPQLTNVDVTHVSLVKSPANRTPFKFIKRADAPAVEETPTMHFALKHLAGQRAEVTAVIAKTAEQAAAMATLMLGEGEHVATEPEAGVFVVRKAGTEPTANERIVSAGGELGLHYVVDRVSKELMLYDDTTLQFDEVVLREGFVPGLMAGLDALNTTIRNAAMSSDVSTPDAFRQIVMSAVEDFGDYMDRMISELPTQAFKFEKAVLHVTTPQGLVRPEGLPEGFDEATFDAIFTFRDDESGDPKAADPAGEPDPAAQEPQKPQDPAAYAAAPASEAADPAAPEPASEDADPTEALVEKMSGLIGEAVAKAVAPVSAKLGEVTEGLGSLETRVAKAEETARVARDTASGVVPGDGETDVAPAGRRLTKGVDEAPPYLDTARNRP